MTKTEHKERYKTMCRAAIELCEKLGEVGREMNVEFDPRILPLDNEIRITPYIKTRDSIQKDTAYPSWFVIVLQSVPPNPNNRNFSIDAELRDGNDVVRCMTLSDMKRALRPERLKRLASRFKQEIK